MHWAIKPLAVGLVGFEKCLPFVPIHLFPVARARAWHSSKLCPFLACWNVAFSAMTGPEQTASANAITATRNICLLHSVADSFCSSPLKPQNCNLGNLIHQIIAP